MERTLSHDAARRFYDGFGRLQDLQAFYESPAVEQLARWMRFRSARSVVELGPGTGRLARRLLARELPPEARYLGIEASETMARLTRERLQGFSDRAHVQHTDGSLSLDVPSAGCDRFVTTYVLDLLSEADIARALAEAHRALEPGGRLGVVSLTRGTSLPARAVCRAWETAHRIDPMLVGGCRPITVWDHLDAASWEPRRRAVVCVLGICSEVLVATRR